MLLTFYLRPGFSELIRRAGKRRRVEGERARTLLGPPALCKFSWNDSEQDRVTVTLTVPTNSGQTALLIQEKPIGCDQTSMACPIENTSNESQASLLIA